MSELEDLLDQIEKRVQDIDLEIYGALALLEPGTRLYCFLKRLSNRINGINEIIPDELHERKYERCTDE